MALPNINSAFKKPSIQTPELPTGLGGLEMQSGPALGQPTPEQMAGRDQWVQDPNRQPTPAPTMPAPSSEWTAGANAIDTSPRISPNGNPIFAPEPTGFSTMYGTGGAQGYDAISDNYQQTIGGFQNTMETFGRDRTDPKTQAALNGNAKAVGLSGDDGLDQMRQAQANLPRAMWAYIRTPEDTWKVAGMFKTVHDSLTAKGFNEEEATRMIEQGYGEQFFRQTETDNLYRNWQENMGQYGPEQYQVDPSRSEYGQYADARNSLPRSLWPYLEEGGDNSMIVGMYNSVHDSLTQTGFTDAEATDMIARGYGEGFFQKAVRDGSYPNQAGGQGGQSQGQGQQQQPGPSAYDPRFEGIYRPSTPDTNVANIAAEMMEQDSPLMRQAEARGRQFGASRGMLNSSMTGGAMQAATLDYITPMASQEASQRFEDGRAVQDYSISSLLSNQDFSQNRQLAEDQYGYQRGLADQGYGHQLGLNEQAFGFDTQLAEQAGDIQSRLEQERFGYESSLSEQDYNQRLGISDQEYNQQLGLNEQAFGFDSALSEQDYNQQLGLNEQGYNQQIGVIDREAEIQTDRDAALFEYEKELEGIRNQFAGDQADADRELERDLQDNQIEANFELAEMDNETSLQIINIEERMRENLEKLRIELESKNVSMDAFLTAREQFNGRLRDIAANPNMSSEDRIAAIRAEQDILDDAIIAIEDMYSIDLSWTDYVPDTAPQGAEDVRDQINELFNGILGRDAARPGLNNYVTKVLSGEMTMDDVQTAILNSNEANPGGLDGNTGTNTGNMSMDDATTSLTSIYQELLGRSPDAEGLDYYAQALVNGSSTVDDIRSYIANSTEGQLAAGYRDLLGKEPDPVGMEYWLGEIEAGRHTINSVLQKWAEEGA